MKKIGIILLLIAILLFAFLVFWPLKPSGGQKLFTVGVGELGNKSANDSVIFNLVFSLRGAKLAEGGYYFSENMSVWDIVSKIKDGPQLKWVKIMEGMRKEQIGEVLANTFNWSNDQLEKWNKVDTDSSDDYFEGVYFPDTYLIPVNETGADIAKRMTGRFNEKMADLFPKFAEKNIKWTTGLKIASLIQREAGGKDDMGIISGVIWNRLDKGMALQIDATSQYIIGNSTDGWWGRVTPSDLKIESPYNSYLNKGLPPNPICNPGINAIEAALNPEETECLFYLHDSNRQIHCAKTYEEHLLNIEKYLN